MIAADQIADALEQKPLPKIDPSMRVILYGAGQLGRWTLKAMRDAGLPDPVCFMDRNSGSTIDGIHVKHPSDIVTFTKPTLVVVTIYNGAAVREECRKRSWRTVGFAEYYRGSLLGKPTVPIPYGALDDPKQIRQQEPLIRRGLDVWDDDASREEYLSQIRYRINLTEPSCEPLPMADIYFPPEQPFAKHECFVDCGAFDGDTIRAFQKRRTVAKDRIIAIEADPENFRKLVVNEIKGSTHFVNAAVSNVHGGSIPFAYTGTAGSGMNEKVSTFAETVTLDRLLKAETPTRIKMDIEGSEPMALVGAAKTIKRCKPMLAICLYHAPEHLWTIPLYLKSIAPDYRLYLRRYSEGCSETILYAVV